METTFGERRPRLPLRLAAVFTGALVIWLLMAWLSQSVSDRLAPAAGHAANAVVVCVLAVPMVVAARRWLDRRPWSGLGLTGPRTGWWPLLVGAAAWLLPAAAGTLVTLSAGWAQITVAATAVELLTALLLLTALVLLFEAVPEELIFRGYLYRNLSAALAPWLAVAGQAVLFALFGTVLWTLTDGWTVTVVAERLPLFLVMGVVLGVIRVLAGNLWACVGYHLAFQVAAQLLLGSRYADIQVRGEETLTLVAFGAAFLLGPTAAARLLRTRPHWQPPNWRSGLPDPRRDRPR